MGEKKLDCFGFLFEKKKMKLREEDLEKLTRSDLIKIILELVGKIEELELKIAKLEKNSRNSSKPPGSDGEGKKILKTSRSYRERKLREKKGNRLRKTRVQVENPDEIIEQVPEKCEECGRFLEDRPGEVKGRRQEADIPPIVPKVVEYRTIRKTCVCGHSSTGKFPERLRGPTQFGANIKSFLVYLSVAQLIPYKRLGELCEDLFGLSVCKKSIENALEDGFQKALPVYKKIREIV